MPKRNFKGRGRSRGKPGRGKGGFKGPPRHNDDSDFESHDFIPLEPRLRGHSRASRSSRGSSRGSSRASPRASPRASAGNSRATSRNSMARQSMTGKRILKDMGPLRDRPLQFVKAEESYDPESLLRKMVRDTTLDSTDPAVDRLEREEKQHELDTHNAEAPESADSPESESESEADSEAGLESESELDGDVSQPQTGPERGQRTVSIVEPEEYGDQSSEGDVDSDHTGIDTLSSDVPGRDTQDELEIDNLNLQSSSYEPESEDGVADDSLSDSARGSGLDSGVDSDSDLNPDVEMKDGEVGDGEISEAGEVSDGEASDGDASNSDELNDDEVAALQRLALRDLDGDANGNYSDYFDDEDADFSSEEADDMIQQLIEGSVDFAKYERRLKKTKNKALPVENSQRRKERRKERELARLTNFGKDAELWQKYPEAMTVNQVVDELAAFIHQDEPQEIRFPPFDHNANHYVRELAKLHGLASYMQGRKNVKCIVVARTNRCGPIRDYGRLKSLMSRRRTFKRVDRDLEPAESAGAKKTARLRDGEVVGLKAETIPSDNFGHQLMKKMGWSEGTGLGASRAGITVPISATVKLTKRGIGERDRF